MSLEATVWALKHAPVPGGDPLALLVLIGLANHAAADGTGARPSVATLAEYARCSARSVHTKLRMLETAGLIVRGDQQAVAHLRADRRPTVWDLAVDGVQQVHAVQQPVQAVEPHGVHATTSRGEQPGIHGVHASADRTVLEPSLKEGGSYVPTSPARDDDNPTPWNDLGGNTPDPAARPPLRYPDRCPDHQRDGATPPCGGCKVARMTHEASLRDAVRAEAEAERVRRLEEARLMREEAARCLLCDDEGRDATGMPCSHDPAVADRARRGAAAARAVLGTTTTTEVQG